MDAEVNRIRKRLEVIRPDRIKLQLEEEALIERLFQLLQKGGERHGTNG